MKLVLFTRFLDIHIKSHNVIFHNDHLVQPHTPSLPYVTTPHILTPRVGWDAGRCQAFNLLSLPAEIILLCLNCLTLLMRFFHLWL